MSHKKSQPVRRFILLTLFFFVLFVAVSALSLRTEILSANVLFLDGICAIIATIALQSVLESWLFAPLLQLSATLFALSNGVFQKNPRIRSFQEIETLGEVVHEMADQTAEKLQDAEKNRLKTEAILSGMMEGVVVLDRQGKIVLTNLAFENMFDLSRATLSGRYHYEVIRHHQLNLLIEAVRKKQQPISMEIGFDRARSYFEVHATPILDASSWIVLVFHNITEIKRLEQVRSDFIANISHELKTPLSVIKGYLETVTDEWNEDAEKTKEYLEILRQQTDRMQNIVSDLLQLSRIESGTDSVCKEAIWVKEYTEKILLSFTPIAKKKAIQLLFWGNDFCFWADTEKLCRALSNLLDNAIKYTPSGGKVILEVAEAGEEVSLSVLDTGIGIPKVDQARIFERFYRVDRARSRDLGGTGLGLSIVKHIVDAHEGKVTVQSEMGQGTRFTITLPGVYLAVGRV